MEAVEAILLFGLSYYFAAVLTATQALITTVAVVATTVVYGLSFFFYSVVADVVETASANPYVIRRRITVA